MRSLRPSVVLLILGASALPFGCQTAPKTEEPLVFFPPPPDIPRIQYLTWASGADQVEPGHTGFEEFILGEEPAVKRMISKPYGVAARDGVVYVCDTKGLCLSRLDFKNQTFSVIGASGPGRLRKPINVIIDPLGYKFVADPVRKQIVVFDPEDKYATVFDIPEPCHPVDVALYENELFVLDNDDTCQIVVLDRSSGKVLRTFGEPGGKDGQFMVPGSLSIGPDGFLYVSDTHNWRIQKLTRNGVFVWKKGEPGYGIGQFGRPRGLRVGPDGVVYIADAATEIVQMFNSDGEILMQFGGPGDSPGALALPSSVALDATSIPYFQKYIHKKFEVDYLVFVASQYGTRLISVYAFGSFPEGYTISASEVADLPPVPVDQGIGPIGDREVPADSEAAKPPHPGIEQP